ncbi:hypothetical protein ABPG77_002374 [Micractinium sp. CCAP 211/92]
MATSIDTGVVPAMAQAPTNAAPPEQLYELPGLEGRWTMEQLVEMDLQRDPRVGQVRRSALPAEFWDARRRARNHARLQRNYGRRKRRGEALRQEEEERLAGMGEEQRAAYATQREAEREAAKAAAAQQRQRVADAMEHGLRVVVDCSLSLPLPAQQVASNGAAAPGGASDREVRSLCKQLELCAAANKRAIAPVSLRFASFTGRVRAFAEEGMHADRWPAARGHGEVLDQLFPSDQLVVLSPDAEEPLNTLEQGKVYVIGGLVDRTVQKGASLRLAQRHNACARRLPIAEHLGTLAKGKGVLNVNDVFAALLAVHAGQDWKVALEAAIPQRFRPAPTATAASASAAGSSGNADAAAAPAKPADAWPSNATATAGAGATIDEETAAAAAAAAGAVPAAAIAQGRQEGQAA